MVLLKNDGLLPLKPGIKKIAVIGPLADQTRPLIGNYAGQPTHIVSILDGLRAEFPNATITFVPEPSSCARMELLCRTAFSPLPMASPASRLTTTKACGEDRRLAETNTKPLVSRTEPNVKLTENNLPAEVAGKKTFGVQWSGFLTPDRIGRLPSRHSLRRIRKACG